MSDNPNDAIGLDFSPMVFDNDEAYNDEPLPAPQPKVQPAPQPAPQPAAPVTAATPPRQRRTRPAATATTAATAAAPTPAAADTAVNAVPRKPLTWRSMWYALVDGRTVMFAGILLAIAAAYLLIVAISYFSTVVHDQNLTDANTLAALALKSDEVRNAGGPLGAWLSDRLISRWMGIGVFILIVWMAMSALAMLKVVRYDFWKMTFRAFFLAIAVSVVTGFFTFNLSSPVYWGGMHGYRVTAQVTNFAGFWGGLALCLILIALVAVMYMGYITAATSNVSHMLAVWRERRNERRERALQEARQRAAERELEEAAARHVDIDDDTPEVSVPEEAPFEPVPLRAPAAPATIGEPDSMPMEIEVPEPELVTDLPTHVAEPAPVAAAEPRRGSLDTLYDPRADLSGYHFPDVDLLVDHDDGQVPISLEEQEENKQRIIEALANFGISITSIKATIGPTVTLYQVVPDKGVTIARIKKREDDLALSLAALGIRIIAPMPGLGTIGIEVPNKNPRTVSMRTVLTSRRFQESVMELPMAIGATISNDVFMVDLAKMPHLLVAGATGMGKSVGLNAIITSLLYKKHPAELKFVFIDPKAVELMPYSKIANHFLAKLPDDEYPVVIDASKVVAVLNSLVLEMENRYRLLMEAGVRGIKDYNRKFVERRLNPEKGHRFLPYIVVVVDEYADLMSNIGKEVETPISRIAAKARAAGIHMILATQRPSTNVVTGVIKANFPGRIAFRVNQRVDSGTILDRNGADQLIGRGDMLVSNNGIIERVQCAFVDTPEVEALTEYIGSQPGYGAPYELPEYVPDDTGAALSGNERDSLFETAARLVVQSGTASTSNLQRTYSIGYNRAGKIMDQLCAAGIVGPAKGSKPRDVLVDSFMLEHMLDNEATR